MFAKNRERRLSQGLFCVDGMQIEAWALSKSFQAADEEPAGEDGSGDDSFRGGRNAASDFYGARWSNATHSSTTDDDFQLYREGRSKEAKLSYMDHALMETRETAPAFNTMSEERARYGMFCVMKPVTCEERRIEA